MSKEVTRYSVAIINLHDAEPMGMEQRVVLASDYDALLAGRDQLREALEEIVAADWSSSETATDFAISQTKGFLISRMKQIAREALQGERP